MNKLLTFFAVGLLFGAGLIVSGMTQADKVIAFLHVTGDWDPSLAFVMGGAIAVHWVLFRLILKQPSPVFAERFGIPTRTDINPRLVGGAALFGAGWGLGGYCPGPGLVSLGSFSDAALVFVGAMTVGMAGFHMVEQAMAKPATPSIDAASAAKTAASTKDAA